MNAATVAENGPENAGESKLSFWVVLTTAVCICTSLGEALLIGEITHSSNLATSIALPILVQVLPWLLPNARHHPAKTSTAICIAFSLWFLAAWWTFVAHPLDVTDSTSFNGTGMTAGREVVGTVDVPEHREYLRLTFSLSNAYPEAEDCIPATSMTTGLYLPAGPEQLHQTKPGDPTYFRVPHNARIVRFWVRLSFNKDPGCVMDVNVRSASLQEWQ